MEDREDLPCTNCHAPVDLAEPDCPHCGSSLLVDVVLSARPGDSRLRYRIARAVRTVEGAPPMAEIQRALAGTPSTAARGVTRAVAHALLPVLATVGVRASLRKAAPPPAPQGFPLRALLGASAAVLVVVLAYLGWSKATHRTATPGPEQTAPVTSPAADGGESADAGPAKSARELAREALRAAVSLRCPNSVGSGFFVSDDLVVTNAHVLCEGDSIQVKLSDDRTFRGEVERRSDRIDLALVRVAGVSGRALPLGDVGELEVADRVVVVGSPVGLDFTVHEGNVSSLRRTADGIAYIQLDVKVSPGNSGGPVIDSRGRVVGVVSMKLSGEGVEGIGLALPINYAYGDELGFVSPPSNRAAASQRFSQMLAQAREGEGGGLQDVASVDSEPPAFEEDDRPLLVGASVDQYGRLVARIVRVTEYEPPFEEVTVSLWNGLDRFCTVKGDIRSWRQVDAGSAARGLDPRVANALAGLARGRTLFVGESPLRWDLCDRTRMRSGMEVELEGANPAASRLAAR
jgi:serine protease Do